MAFVTAKLYPAVSLLLVALALAASALAGMSDEERAAVLAPTTNFSTPEPWEELQGGSATNRSHFDRNAYSQPSANLTFEERSDFLLGDSLFRRAWVVAPASTTSADGLGPLYNARSCQRCHLKDGRGHPPEGLSDSAVSMFLRISVPARSEIERELLVSHHASVIAEPTYGTQIQDISAPGFAAEGRMVVTYEPWTVDLSNGETVVLRKPTYALADLGYGPLDPDVMLSPRIAPPMIGLGLIEAIAAEDILANADPDDADDDSISGRPNWVWSIVEERVALGRFGLKAGTPNIAEQSARAMAGDIGIGNPLAPALWGDCTEAQASCRDASHGPSPETGFEISAELMDFIVFYARNLSVPARRDVSDPTVLEGKQLFYEIGCISCHTPKFATRPDAVVAALGNQLIWPYSDLLLHDMGEGLADHHPEGEASGREWRTAPLWGIGMTETVSGHTYFLHDGRARNLVEAILWHGGEAQGARDAFAGLPKDERAAVIAFLGSL